MKHCRKIIFVIIIIIILIVAITISCRLLLGHDKNNTNEYSDSSCKYVIFFNRYNKNGSNRKNLVFYYDEHMNLLYKETFKAENKVPNQIMIDNTIYSYGYGGIFKTDILEKKTSALNTETSVNIVKYDEVGNVYAYQNFGFEKGDSGKYISKIIKNNMEYLQLDYPVVDFCVYNNILYVTTYNDISMKDGKIGIYENQKLIKEFDVDLSNGEGCWAIYDKSIFFLKTNSAFIVDKSEIKEIHFEGLNEKLVMPIVTSNSNFDKLYINSMEVQYIENKLIFKESKMIDYINYNPLIDSRLECYFDKEEQTLKINETIIKIDNNKKYNYVFLSAFEI